MIMKSPIELLQEVKKLVFQEVTAPAPSYSLEDGTKIMIDKLEVGGIVTLADGTPAPAGEHYLADGTEIILGEGGVITEIKPKEVASPEAPAVPTAPEDMGNKKDQAMQEQFAAIESRIASYESNFSALKSDYEVLKTAFGKQSEAMQGLIQLVDTLVNVPSQAPAEVPNNFTKHSASTKEDKIRSYSQFVSQFKK